MTAQEKEAWLKELEERRLELKRQLFAADSQSASLSSGGGTKSFTNRSIAELKEKIAAVENEIAAVCRDLDIPVPFDTSRGVYKIKVRF